MAGFSFSRTESGWRMEVDDSALGGPLEGVFRYELRLQDLPSGLPVVGHCRVMGLWCVFATDRQHTGFEGVVLHPDEYVKHAFDPFIVAAHLLGSKDLQQAVSSDPASVRDQPPAGPMPVTDHARYLQLAYSAFLTSDTTARQSLYCSVLAEGSPRRISPLTCFVVRGDELMPHGLVVELHDARLGDPASDLTVAHASDPFPIDAEEEPRAPVPETAPPPQQPSAPDVDLFDKPLARTSMVHAEEHVRPVEPEPDSVPAQRAEPSSELGERFLHLERRVQRRTWILSAVLVAVIAAAAVAITLVHADLRAASAALEASKLDVETVRDGLALSVEGRTAEVAIRAALRDLSTVSVQSGAWQEGLRSRGVSPERFLDRLVELAARDRRLLTLADSEPALSSLAGEAERLGELLERHERLLNLSDRSETLLALVVQSVALGELASRKQDIDAVLAQQEALIALAARRQDLQELLEYSATLRSLAREVANVLTFQERWQGDLEQLASRRSQLAALAGNKDQLDRLLQISPALVDLARNQDALNALAERLANLVALSDRASELLALAEQAGG